jgi:hypothetical protein
MITKAWCCHGEMMLLLLWSAARSNDDYSSKKEQVQLETKYMEMLSYNYITILLLYSWPEKQAPAFSPGPARLSI